MIQRFFSTEAKAVIDLTVKPADEKELNVYLSFAHYYLNKEKTISLEQILYIISLPHAASTFGKAFIVWLKNLIDQRNKDQSVQKFINTIPEQYAAYKKTLSADELEFINNPLGERLFRDVCKKLFQKAKQFTPLAELVKILPVCLQTKISIEAGDYKLDSQEKTLADCNRLIKRMCEEHLEHACDIIDKRIAALICGTIPPLYNFEVLLRTVNEGQISILLPENEKPRIDAYQHFISWLYEDMQAFMSTHEMNHEKSLKDLVNHIIQHFRHETFSERYCEENSSEFKSDGRLDTDREWLLNRTEPERPAYLLTYGERMKVRDAIISELPAFAVACELERSLIPCCETLDILAKIPLADHSKNSIANILTIAIQQIVLTAETQGIYVPPYKCTLAARQSVKQQDMTTKNRM